MIQGQIFAQKSAQVTGCQFFRCGSAAVTLSYVACGRLLGYYEALINSWDCMAGLCIIEEAGGWTKGFSGSDPLTEPMTISAGAPQIQTDLADVIHRAKAGSAVRKA